MSSVIFFVKILLLSSLCVQPFFLFILLVWLPCVHRELFSFLFCFLLKLNDTKCSVVQAVFPFIHAFLRSLHPCLTLLDSFIQFYQNFLYSFINMLYNKSLRVYLLGVTLGHLFLIDAVLSILHRFCFLKRNIHYGAYLK